MKKLILTVTTIILAVSVMGQQYSDRYYLNECFLPPQSFPVVLPLTYTSGLDVSDLIQYLSESSTNKIFQPYNSDTIICVRGIAGLLNRANIFSNVICQHGYFRISKNNFLIDSLLLDTVQTQVSVSMLNKYVELFFQQPIFLKGVFDVEMTIDNRDIYNNPENCAVMIGIRTTGLTDTSLHTPCCSNYPAMVELQGSTPVPLASSNISSIVGNYSTMLKGCDPNFYLFPILDTIPVFSRITTTITNDSTNGTFVCTTDIDTSNALTLPYEAGFIYSTDTTGGLTLNNPNVNIINYLYDTTTNTFNELINYNNFPCNEPVYYRSFLTTTIETWYDTMTQTNYGETETFSYNIDITQPTNLTIVEDAEVSLTLSWTGDARSYQIIRNNQHLAYIDTNVYVDTNIVFGETYTYQVKGISYQCQSDTSNPVSYTTTNDLNNILNENNIKLYPNPTDKELTIETTIPIQKIEIVNSNGQTIYTNEPNKKEVKINTSSFVTGNYVAVITTSKGVFKRQFVMK